MTAFLAQFGQQLADRWVSLLAIPGLLYVAACFAAVELGQGHAVTPLLLFSCAGRAASQVSKWSAAVQAVTLVGLVLASSAVGLVVQGLIGPVRAIAFGDWAGPLRPAAKWLVNRRQARWKPLWEHAQRLKERDELSGLSSGERDELSQISARMNAIALTMPKRPTWVGDRMHALSEVVFNRHGLDLAFGWPRLWLILPDDIRAEVSAIQGAVAGSLFTIAWSIPYLVLATRWWPAGIIGLLVALAGRSRLRGQVSILADLIEAALELHGRELAVAFGVALPDAAGPLTPEEGSRLTAIIRRGR